MACFLSSCLFAEIFGVLPSRVAWLAFFGQKVRQKSLGLMHCHGTLCTSDTTLIGSGTLEPRGPLNTLLRFTLATLSSLCHRFKETTTMQPGFKSSEILPNMRNTNLGLCRTCSSLTSWTKYNETKTNHIVTRFSVIFFSLACTSFVVHFIGNTAWLFSSLCCL